MREIVFIRQNVEKWRQYEKILNGEMTVSPDVLSDLFIQITDDLSYSRTHYPGSKTVEYLNELAVRTHQKIYLVKKEETSRIKYFWLTELPLLFYERRFYLLYSFLFFFLFSFIGSISALKDDTFIRYVLGDLYVEETLRNIRNGNAMGIYGSSGQAEMFFRISLNNIWVSFKAFSAGMLASVGTVYILFTNGVMLGAVQTFFYQQQVLGESLLAIWVHGTIEITCIIVAGAAGFVLGNSFLFPGTYSRLVSLMKGAKDGTKMIIGLVPLFVLAAFLEGFVTRYSKQLPALAFTVIVLSLFFCIYYFVWYPYQLFRRYESNPGITRNPSK